MSEQIDFEERLKQKYPKLFYECGDILSCPCGVDVPLGWEKIIDNLCGSIYDYVLLTVRYRKDSETGEIIKEEPSFVKIDQIKQKFGGLRFYCTGGDSDVSGMIRFAEFLCDKTCEVTGEEGQLCKNSSGWYRTLSESICKTEEYSDFKIAKKLL